MKYTNKYSTQTQNTHKHYISINFIQLNIFHKKIVMQHN